MCRDEQCDSGTISRGQYRPHRLRAQSPTRLPSLQMPAALLGFQITHASDLLATNLGVPPPVQSFATVTLQNSGKQYTDEDSFTTEETNQDQPKETHGVKSGRASGAELLCPQG